MIHFFFGLMSAPLAKFTPEILSALAADMEVASEPAALDAWKQFYKNVSDGQFLDRLCRGIRLHGNFMERCRPFQCWPGCIFTLDDRLSVSEHSDGGMCHIQTGFHEHTFYGQYSRPDISARNG